MKGPFSFDIEELGGRAVADQRVEIVERKGVGHPDTICDMTMEAVSVRLSLEYLRRFGRVLHHNNDKAFLVGGRSRPALGGGVVDEPMRLIMGDRAARVHDGQEIPVGQIAREAVHDWIRTHLRFVDPEKHVILQDEIKPGSPELVGNFRQAKPGANDTSVGVGHAPLTPTETITLELERHMQTKPFHQAFPFAGEDVKVMAVRTGRRLDVTIALAFVDRHVATEREYFDGKAAAKQAATRFIEEQHTWDEGVRVEVNTLDRPGRGAEGLYLTVLGTSAEGGDSGEVGRGNRANGLITFNRPMSLEAVAGKNAVSHTGKIYNLLAKQMAERVCEGDPRVREATVRLISRIGYPLNEPLTCSAQLVLAQGQRLDDVRSQVAASLAKDLEDLPRFIEDVARGKYSVC